MVFHGGVTGQICMNMGMKKSGDMTQTTAVYSSNPAMVLLLWGCSVLKSASAEPQTSRGPAWSFLHLILNSNSTDSLGCGSFLVKHQLPL
ncbi:hypothetical protein AOLI_G00050870 [Acnodon oligacanthus]